MTVTVPERDESASGIAERKLNELSGSELVRNHKPGNGCHAAASLNDAAHGLVGPQFHHNVEASGIDATLSQSVLKYLAGTRAFLAQHPPSRQQMVEFDRVGLRELVRRPDHHNELIDSYRNLNQERFVNVSLDEAEIGVAIENGASNVQRVADVQFDRHARMDGVEIVKECRQPITGDSLARPKPQAAT
jgi:hypothetical protein